MPSGKQDTDFAQYMTDDDMIKVDIVVSKSALDTAIWWIARELNPDDVFSDKDLQAWAEKNGYVKE